MDQTIRQCLQPGGQLSLQIEQYESRPQQLQMSLDIATTLQSVNGILMAEAGTGTGKSLAYLIPAALLRQNVVVSTGTKALQEQLINKDIPLLNTLLEDPINAVLVKGRRNYLCARRFNQFRDRPEFQSMAEKRRFSAVCDWVAETKSGDRAEMDFLPDFSPLWNNICSRRDDCMGGRCPEYATCYLLKLRVRAQAADLVVVNHHLFFADAALRRSSAMAALPDSQAVIFDEAHLLDDIVTQFLGVHLGQPEILDLIRLIRRWKPTRKELGGEKWALAGALGSVEEGAAMFFGSMPSGEGRFELLPQMSDEIGRYGTLLIERVENLSQALEKDGLIPEEFTAEWKQVCRGISDKTRFFLAHDEPGMAWWGEHTSQGNILHACPIEIADEFPKIIQDPIRPVVLTSATLTTGNTFNYMTDRLGLQHATTAVYPSPFDYPNQGQLYIPDHLPDPNHNDFLAACSTEIMDIVNATNGRAFILTTSYSAMRAIREQIEDQLEFRMLVQGDAPKRRLIREFIEDTHSVLLATMSFWQGVDVPGEALSTVIINRLPFGSPGDPMIRARIEFMNDNGVNAFFNYQIPSAVMMLKQGVGRLIRSKSDRGLIAVLDNRIIKKQYGRQFLDSLPGFSRVRSIDEVITFFNGIQN